MTMQFYKQKPYKQMLLKRTTKGSILIPCAIVTVVLLTVTIAYMKYKHDALAQPDSTCSVRIINSGNKTVICTAEVARTNEEHARGLMHRKDLCKNCGMLFVFQNEDYRSFWMKNTLIPLSIAFIDKDGIINDIQDMEPLRTFPSYSSRYPAAYALEVNKGWFKKNLITIGSRVILDGCIGK